MKIWTSLKLIVVLCIFIACKKEEVKQYSYWKIDGKEYSSNNVWVNGGERGDGRRSLVSGGDESFSIGFNTGISSLPDQGVFCWSVAFRLKMRPMSGSDFSSGMLGKVISHQHMNVNIYKQNGLMVKCAIPCQKPGL